MNRKIVIISGLSGAGKTSVTNVLEDLGFYCIDQLPPQLMNNLMGLIENDLTLRYQNVGITVSLMELENYLEVFDNLDIDMKLILLDAKKEVLLNRYKFTRRIHPLLVSNIADTLEEAIDIEKDIMVNLKLKYETIDTTNLGQYELKNVVESLLSIDKENKFTISFESFGFKNGIASDADLVFDVRFLENPFYDEKLKHLTGNDIEVYNFVMVKESTKEYLKYLLDYLNHSFEMYIKEGKRYLTVAIGCTGGQHRSASIVNYLYRYYSNRYNCLKKHRDIK